MLNDKIALWEDLSNIASQLFRDGFEREILVPLLIGAFNVQMLPLFTLKFSLFVLTKLLKVL